MLLEYARGKYKKSMGREGAGRSAKGIKTEEGGIRNLTDVICWNYEMTDRESEGGGKSCITRN